jgi:hypothetical protein
LRTCGVLPGYPKSLLMIVLSLILALLVVVVATDASGER